MRSIKNRFLLFTSHSVEVARQMWFGWNKKLCRIWKQKLCSIKNAEPVEFYVSLWAPKPLKNQWKWSSKIHVACFFFCLGSEDCCDFKKSAVAMKHPSAVSCLLNMHKKFLQLLLSVWSHGTPVRCWFGTVYSLFVKRPTHRSKSCLTPLTVWGNHGALSRGCWPTLSPVSPSALSETVSLHLLGETAYGLH